jgi:SOS response regulatory protein OraA/RecX
VGIAFVAMQIALSSASVAVADTPMAAAREDAARRYLRAVELYDDGAYAEAIVEFRRAYALSPSWKILYNIGVSALQLRDHATAMQELERYLDQGGAEVPATKREELRRTLAELERRVGKISIVVDRPHAEILVDDVPVGRSPLPGPIRVNVGRRRIVGVFGTVTATKVVEIAGGEALTVRIDAPPVVAEGPPTARAIPWLWWGTTGVLAAGTVTMGILALRAANDHDRLRGEYVDPADLAAANRRTANFALSTDILAVATIASASWSTYLTFRTPGPRPTATAAVAPVAGGAVFVFEAAR